MKSENNNNESDLFLGIEVHKKSWKVACYTRDTAFKTLSMEPNAKKLSFFGMNIEAIVSNTIVGQKIYLNLLAPQPVLLTKQRSKPI